MTSSRSSSTCSRQVGDDQPIITAADFSLTNEKSGVASLLDSVANQLHKDLREKAMRNLEAVQDAVTNAAKTLPHCEEIISALWLRSLDRGQARRGRPGRPADRHHPQTSP